MVVQGLTRLEEEEEVPGPIRTGRYVTALCMYVTKLRQVIQVELLYK